MQSLYGVAMLFHYSAIDGKIFLADVDAFLAKLTEALLANYRMRFKSQSATGTQYKTQIKPIYKT